MNDLEIKYSQFKKILSEIEAKKVKLTSIWLSDNEKIIIGSQPNNFVIDVNTGQLTEVKNLKTTK